MKSQPLTEQWIFTLSELSYADYNQKLILGVDPITLSLNGIGRCALGLDRDIP